MYMNCLVFVNISHRDKRASSTRDNGRRSSFQVTSSCYVLCYTICYHRCNSFRFKNLQLFVNIFLKVRHVLSSISRIVFAYNVTDEIVRGVFLSRLVGINIGQGRKNTQLDHSHKKQIVWKHGPSYQKSLCYVEIYRAVQNTGNDFQKKH